MPFARITRKETSHNDSQRAANNGSNNGSNNGRNNGSNNGSSLQKGNGHHNTVDHVITGVSNKHNNNNNNNNNNNTNKTSNNSNNLESSKYAHAHPPLSANYSSTARSSTQSGAGTVHHNDYRTRQAPVPGPGLASGQGLPPNQKSGMRERRYRHSDKSANHSIPYHHQHRHHHHSMNHEVDNDWICPNCHALVFAFRSCCYKCQTPRHEGGGGGEGAPMETPLDVYYTLRPPPYGDVREGDWLCIGCGGHNFAFTIACFTCHTPRPQGEYPCPYQPPVPHHPHIPLWIRCRFQ